MRSADGGGVKVTTKIYKCGFCLSREAIKKGFEKTDFSGLSPKEYGKALNLADKIIKNQPESCMCDRK